MVDLKHSNAEKQAFSHGQHSVNNFQERSPAVVPGFLAGGGGLPIRKFNLLFDHILPNIT